LFTGLPLKFSFFLTQLHHYRLVRWFVFQVFAIVSIPAASSARDAAGQRLAGQAPGRLATSLPIGILPNAKTAEPFVTVAAART
jgi:hypothetical protein